MVDPRFRGHHLMGAARDLRDAVAARARRARPRGRRGHRAHPVADRPAGHLDPARLPAGRSSSGASTAPRCAHREAVAGGHLPGGADPGAAGRAPRARRGDDHARSTGCNDLRPHPGGGRPGAPAPALDVARSTLEVRGDLGHAVLTCAGIGADLRRRGPRAGGDGRPRRHRRRLRRRPARSTGGVRGRSTCSTPRGSSSPACCPLAHRGTDVVRYQRLGDTVVDPDEIHLKHPFGRSCSTTCSPSGPSSTAPA